MRVPIPIAIGCCFIATGAMWYLSTRNADFTTAPSPAEQQQTAEQWKQKNIPPPSASPLSSDLQTKKATPDSNTLSARPPLIKQPTPTPPPKQLPLGDLKQSPQLSEYGTLGNHGSRSMIGLATELESKLANQRAWLAWERVLDTTQPDETQHKQATEAILRLSSELGPWNADPTSDITLTLHAGATLNNKAALEKALKTTAETISNASGHILKINTKITFGRGKPPETPRVPIAIWFSRSPQKSGSAGETLPFSFMTDPSEGAMLTSQCQRAVYSLLRAYLTDDTSYTPLPEPPAGVKPDHLLRHYVTRLTWREFANSLKK